ncbi:hypothetical protein [Polyangium aurulentum]|uniref:hypothetical protein n=1 Tax=Polyangium aurulentum TaxID=2567896 RepID=UPI001F357C06|nr:hypothetical protein [Polyangium aurulentum]
MRAEPAALADAGAGLGIVVTPAPPGGFALVALWGFVPPTITGLGYQKGEARVSAAGRTGLVDALGTNDYPLGLVDPKGWLFTTDIGAVSAESIRIKLGGASALGVVLEAAEDRTAAFRFGVDRLRVSADKVAFTNDGSFLITQDAAIAGSGGIAGIVAQSGASTGGAGGDLHLEAGDRSTRPP